MIHIPLRSPIPMLDNARIAKYHGVRGHVYVYKTIGSYQHIVANGYFPHNGSVDANPHPVTDSGASLTNATISLSYYNTLVDVAVATYPRPAVDGDIIGMAYKNTPPICRFAVSSNPRRLAQRRNNALYRSRIGAKDITAAFR